MKTKRFVKKASAVTDKTQIYIAGGMAGLSAAIFAARDAHIPGKNIHIFEERNSVGGSLYGEGSPDTHYFTFGDWKFHLKVYNCTWDVLSEIPSLDRPDLSVTEDIFQYIKKYRVFDPMCKDSGEHPFECGQEGPAGLHGDIQPHCNDQNTCHPDQIDPV